MSGKSEVNDDVFRVEDGEAPLKLSNERQVFREQGGADFTVTAVGAVAKRTGEKMTLHFASVKDDRPGAVCVAVIKAAEGPDFEDRYLVARHWRASVGQWEWEFPRGMGEPGETIEETSVRELHEETGISSDVGQIRFLQIIHADAGVLRDNIAVTAVEFSSDEERREALAKVPAESGDVEKVPEESGDGGRSPSYARRTETDCRPGIDWELSHMRWVAESDLKRYIAQGGIVDGITLSSFFLYLLRR
ncbi:MULTISPECIES: NUDIX hydrolase [unclassified Bifidobacterium]|uniref:NUDIX hydrolase n=1 Tax=unclassified Bifidobacterium TaxID=2608897 RepID=UPI0023F85D31|nr:MULTISPECIES: NUDIX hydrolase [unclassified Bifidobacterium]WEV65552.1 NUDIX hydrolase [Bifidobacterium sp. ESL0764]WEV75643.1 NUDIX hydrolase [Bifidobacterium sp. ESL0800]